MEATRMKLEQQKNQLFNEQKYYIAKQENRSHIELNSQMRKIFKQKSATSKLLKKLINCIQDVNKSSEEKKEQIDSLMEGGIPSKFKSLMKKQHSGEQGIITKVLQVEARKADEEYDSNEKISSFVQDKIVKYSGSALDLIDDWDM